MKILNRIKKLVKYLMGNLDENQSQMIEWASRSYLDHAPHFVKMNVLERYSIKDSIWVETGTFQGLTTSFLSKRYPFIYTIEPERNLYKDALEKFRHSNVEIINDTSENVFPDLLKNLKGNVNFWLDGHYSGGITFKGPTNCPVREELDSIEKNIHLMDSLSIMIDDVRCFTGRLSGFDDYPDLNYLVGWANRHNFKWFIEHDIFIMTNHKHYALG